MNERSMNCVMLLEYSPYDRLIQSITDSAANSLVRQQPLGECFPNPPAPFVERIIRRGEVADELLMPLVVGAAQKNLAN